MTADRYVTEAREVREQVQACPSCGRLVKRNPSGHMPSHYGTSRAWPPCDGPRNELRDRWTPVALSLLAFRCGSCGAEVRVWCRGRDGYLTPLHAARFYSAGRQADFQPRPQIYPYMVHGLDSAGRVA